MKRCGNFRRVLFWRIHEVTLVAALTAFDAPLNLVKRGCGAGGAGSEGARRGASGRAANFDLPEALVCKVAAAAARRRRTLYAR